MKEVRDLIRRDDVLGESRTFSVSYDFGQDYDDVSCEVVLVDDIADLDEVDAVEVTRCIDCIHYTQKARDSVTKQDCLDWLTTSNDTDTFTSKHIKSLIENMFNKMVLGVCNRFNVEMSSSDFCSYGEERLCVKTQHKYFGHSNSTKTE